MVNDTPTEDAVRPVSTEVASRAGQPTELLEIEENSVPEVEINYPTGPKLWLTVTTLCVAMFLKGLVRSSNVITMTNEQLIIFQDLTIVAVAVPSLTDQFKTISDIGWYNAA
jgi:hypothetical protein